MRSRRHLVLVALALIGTLLLLAVPVAAWATKIPFTGTWTVLDMGEPGRIWFPDHGRVQARGWSLLTEFHTGNSLVDAEWLWLFDDHFDAGWLGPWNGTFHGVVMCSEGQGAWDGTFTGKSYGPEVDDGGITYCRGQGSGCAAGMKIFLEVENVQGVTTVDGYILDPHGQ